MRTLIGSGYRNRAVCVPMLLTCVCWPGAVSFLLEEAEAGCVSTSTSTSALRSTSTSTEQLTSALRTLARDMSTAAVDVDVDVQKDEEGETITWTMTANDFVTANFEAFHLHVLIKVKEKKKRKLFALRLVAAEDTKRSFSLSFSKTSTSSSSAGAQPPKIPPKISVSLGLNRLRVVTLPSEEEDSSLEVAELRKEQAAAMKMKETIAWEKSIFAAHHSSWEGETWETASTFRFKLGNYEFDAKFNLEEKQVDQGERANGERWRLTKDSYAVKKKPLPEVQLPRVQLMVDGFIMFDLKFKFHDEDEWLTLKQTILGDEDVACHVEETTGDEGWQEF